MMDVKRSSMVRMVLVLMVLRVVSILGSALLGLSEDCDDALYHVQCFVWYDVAYAMTMVGY